MSVDDATALVHAVVRLSHMADRVLPMQASGLAETLRAHLGAVDSVPNTSATFDPIERANLQIALDAVRAATGGDDWTEHGLTPDIGQYGGVSLPSIITGAFHGPGESSRQFVTVEVGAGE